MSKLFAGLERIEAAREHLSGASFMSGLYLGKPDFDLLFPEQEPAEEQALGDAYCKTIEQLLRSHVDAAEIERRAIISDQVLRRLLEAGTFGMIIPKEYGGLGFSHKNYGRVLTLIASWSNILALTVAVPQSIGIAMPILLFGNEEQKKHYLPRVARHDISAFALTEPLTGSDAANIQTEAVPSADGSEFVVNGEKLWCTNGSIARYITLVARVPARKRVHEGHETWVPVAAGAGAEARVPTAFILDTRTPGFSVRHRCQFEGCRGIDNAYISLENVPIPVENVIGEIGLGLRYALTILNIGRAISVPAICLGMAKQAWQPTLDYAAQRVTFKKPIGTRQSQRIRVGKMALDLFAMEALSELVWRMADVDIYDIRIEAAVTKIFCSEQTIEFLKNAQILFGGMGYESADSKRARGQPAFTIEQLVRDAEMYRIGEGATDILRPFVAREGLSAHLERIAPLFDEHMRIPSYITGLTKLAWFYLPWYLSQWRPRSLPDRVELQHAKVKESFVYLERASRTLARAVFYAMLIRREALKDDQGRQNRIARVGEDLFAIAATTLHAYRLEQEHGKSDVWNLADNFFRMAKVRITATLKGIVHNQDEMNAALGRRAIHGEYSSLSNGVVQRDLHDY